MIIQLLRNANGGQIKLQDIMQTVDNMLSTILTPIQRQRKVQNMLRKMKVEGLIDSNGKKWFLAK